MQTCRVFAQTVTYYAHHCTNEYAKENEKEEKEKEKENKTIFTKYHGELLTIMSDCLFINMLVY